MRGEKEQMKGLFKQKPRSPVEVVRQTREMLIYVDMHWNSRDPKREEKVIDFYLLCIFVLLAV